MLKRIFSIGLGPFLSLISFVVGIWRFGESNSAPVLMFSILVLLIGSVVTTELDYFTAVKETSNIYDAVRNHVDVIPIGSPEWGWQYVIHRLPDLDYVQNTSFNSPAELEHTNTRFYTKDFYCDSFATIARSVEQGLTWRDIGDEKALERFRKLQQEIKNPIGSYCYKFLPDSSPQVGFILLTYKDGKNEVLFNWDFHFQNVAQEPTILLSQDVNVINMFAAHYTNLWNVATPSYDSKATKSTS